MNYLTHSFFTFWDPMCHLWSWEPRCHLIGGYIYIYPYCACLQIASHLALSKSAQKHTKTWYPQEAKEWPKLTDMLQNFVKFSTATAVHVDTRGKKARIILPPHVTYKCWNHFSGAKDDAVEILVWDPIAASGDATFPESPRGTLLNGNANCSQI